MTLKEMNAKAKETNICGYTTAEAVFRHGLGSLISAHQALKANSENPIKYHIDRIINDLHDIVIAENILREWYGIMFANVYTHGSRGIGIQVYEGIDELAKVLDREPKETDEFQLKKTFSYDWCEFVQLAERNSREYRKAFSGNPKNYSTTYEKAYGKNAEDDVD